MTNKPRTRLVYSTDPDPLPEQVSAVASAYPSAAGQTARIWRDSKRRRGKTVTVIGGLNHDPATLEALLKKLKQHAAINFVRHDVGARDSAFAGSQCFAQIIEGFWSEIARDQKLFGTLF